MSQFIPLFLSSNGLHQYLIRLIWKTLHYLPVKKKNKWGSEAIQSVQISSLGNKLYKIYFSLLTLAYNSQIGYFSSGSPQEIHRKAETLVASIWPWSLSTRMFLTSVSSINMDWAECELEQQANVLRFLQKIQSPVIPLIAFSPQGSMTVIVQKCGLFSFFTYSDHIFLLLNDDIQFDKYT